MAADGNRVVVDAGAVPALRDAFADALTKVDRQIALVSAGLRVTSWANDPVSVKATSAFNDRSVDTAASALDTLKAYRTQLSSAVEKLQLTTTQYDVSEEDNSATVGTDTSGTG